MKDRASAPVVLVVDDNASKRYSTARLLRAAGFITTEAGTGAQALEMAEEGPDAMVLDVNLPDIDGFEVCKLLRAREHTSHLPIIHLSATFVEDSDRVLGLDSGADGYLTHPVEPKVLVATVNAFVRTGQANQHVSLMLEELDHRVKNTLATVQAIAMQTFASSESLEAFQENFMSRLMALSETHNLLAKERWKGANLDAIVSNELAPYRDRGDTFVAIVGDELMLTPKVSLGIGMALHELATNAAKHGALSVPYGKVTVQWESFEKKEREAWVRLRWSESGGPAVSAPTRRGSGTRLITSGIPMELGGTSVIDYSPSGVVCVIEFPLPGARP